MAIPLPYAPLDNPPNPSILTFFIFSDYSFYFFGTPSTAAKGRGSAAGKSSPKAIV
jgi:hypothetical protein